uniref:Metalloendopeptidase n=1 Tax=Oryzias latipes TaxID=8090 RepID=A0A3P9HAN2_ORYLA
PYILDKSLDLNAKGVIMRAYDQFRLKTCIDFKQWDAEEYYITVQKLFGCYSYIGRVFANGQVLSIGSGCDYIATVEHEFLHALGFYHEQSRYDRDDYVTIVWDNILKGKEHNFDKVGSDQSTTHGTPYDYMSVMHYDNNAFTNGNGSTIITKDPKFEDVIGQRMEMSYYDVQELNNLYKCSKCFKISIICFDGSFPSVKSSENFIFSTCIVIGGEIGYFMHVSTATGQEGDTAQLETQRMTPQRDCHIQCLQFYYYNSGNESDTLNIWIREFENELDLTGTRRLMGQITGKATVVFEARKGAGRSTGGFSVDDINLYETECPHLSLQIDDFQRVLNTSALRSRIYSSRQYSSEGYAYRFAVKLSETYFGLSVQFLSGDYDDQLEWPSLRKQITFEMLDQNPTIQQQMAKRWSFTTNEYQVYSGKSLWDNPRVAGNQVFLDQNNLPVYGGLLYGLGNFATLEEMKTRVFLKGGSAIFTLTFKVRICILQGKKYIQCAM